LRLGALMHAPVVHIFTHDSIGLGQDGPTHQPVEQLPSLRAIPNYWVIRPADANETREAWRAALRHDKGPTALILTRQAVPVLDSPGLANAEGLHRGAYVLWESDGRVDLILMASGSEVSVALEAGQALAARGLGVRIVSMPCWELFEEQPIDYQRSVLPEDVTARVAVEAASPLGWDRWLGLQGAMVAVHDFGHSAPGEEVMDKLGFNASHIIRTAEAVLAHTRAGVQR
ncbi:MAG: transketolase C-terminal domain-containing protein, partial [Dehalococcoidia bacterium]